MNCRKLFTSLFCLSLCGCDVTKVATQINDAMALLNQNKALVEQFVTDIKKTVAPEDPQYQQAQALYATARGLTDDYMAKVTLAALTGDQSVPVPTSAAAAHTAAADFTATATRTLSPQSADRALPLIGLAVAALPPLIHTLLGSVPSNRRAAEIQRFCSTVRWRSWDAL